MKWVYPTIMSSNCFHTEKGVIFIYHLLGVTCHCFVISKEFLQIIFGTAIKIIVADFHIINQNF